MRTDAVTIIIIAFVCGIVVACGTSNTNDAGLHKENIDAELAPRRDELLPMRSLPHSLLPHLFWEATSDDETHHPRNLNVQVTECLDALAWFPRVVEPTASV